MIKLVITGRLIHTFLLFPILGSLLLDSLLSYLTTTERCNCKAAYLHVLSTNQTAIRFYERRNFSAHSYLPYYYSIQGKPRDGYSYVLYINGGKPPWSLLYPFCTFYDSLCYVWVDIICKKLSTMSSWSYCLISSTHSSSFFCHCWTIFPVW